jgi:hypothetical protein
MDLLSKKAFRENSILTKEFLKLKSYIDSKTSGESVTSLILKNIITVYEDKFLMDIPLDIRIKIIEKTYQNYNLEFFTDVNFNSISKKLDILIQNTYKNIYNSGAIEKKDLTKRILKQLNIELKKKPLNSCSENEIIFLKQISFKNIISFSE